MFTDYHSQQRFYRLEAFMLVCLSFNILFNVQQKLEILRSFLFSCLWQTYRMCTGNVMPDLKVCSSYFIMVHHHLMYSIMWSCVDFVLQCGKYTYYLSLVTSKVIGLLIFNYSERQCQITVDHCQMTVLVLEWYEHVYMNISEDVTLLDAQYTGMYIIP